MHATWWLGGVTVPMNTRWAIAEHLYSARDAGFSIVFVDEANRACADELAHAEPALGPFIYKIGRAHSELQSLMRISYAVFCLKKKTHTRDIKYSKLSIIQQIKTNHYTLSTNT